MRAAAPGPAPMTTPLPSTPRSPQRRTVRASTVAFVLAYPALVYLGVTHWEVERVGLLIAAGALVAMAFAVRAAGGRAVARVALPFVPAVIVGLGAGVLGSERLLMALPVLVGVCILAPFALSLRPGSTPLVARFAAVERRARGATGELSPAAAAHCLRFTRLWAAYLLVNALIAGALAWLAWVDAWFVHTFVLGYVGMGVLIVWERIVRPHDAELEAVEGSAP